jgi:hypothetical protein
MDQLRDQALSGGKLESEGRFTFDAAARSRKQLQEPVLFLLKIVQAAVSSRAPRVDFVIGRDRIEGWFHAELEIEQLDGEDAAGPMRYLQQSVQTLVGLSPVSVEVRCGEQSWHWGKAVVKTNAHSGVSLIALLHSTSRLQANCRTELTDRCALCPIPVVLNGHRVNHLHPERLPRLQSKPADIGLLEQVYAGYHWLAEKGWLTSKPAAFCLPQPLFRAVGQLEVAGIQQSFGSDRPLVSVYGYLEGADEAHYDQEGEEAASMLGPPPVPLKVGPSADRLLLNLTFVPFGAENVGLDLLARWALCSLHSFLPYRGGSWLHFGTRKVASLTQLTGLASTLELSLGQPIDELSAKIKMPAMRLQRWVGLRILPDGPSLLVYVQAGVLLDPIEVESSEPAAVGLVACEEKSVDLSLLAPTRDEQVHRDTEWLTGVSQSLTSSCAPIVKSIRDRERVRLPLSVIRAWLQLLR